MSKTTKSKQIRCPNCNSNVYSIAGNSYYCYRCYNTWYK